MFLIRRHGAFFRPNAQGYTDHIGAAGLYSETEARSYLDVEGLTIHPITQYRAEIEIGLATFSRLAAALAEADRSTS
jgi:hypothetical protein